MKPRYFKHGLLLALLINLCLSQNAAAQYANVTDYPFVADTKDFQYLVGGTVLPNIMADDAQMANIPFGFNFPFCGSTYNSGSVSSNGWFSLSATTLGNTVGVNNDNTNLSQFNSNNSLPALMPFWDDLGFIVGGNASYLTTGTAPNRVFTFEWKNWSWDFSIAPGALSFQVKLYENGSIEYAYKRENGFIGSQMGLPTNYFGASIGIVKNTTSDYQFLNATTNDAIPTYSPATFKLNIDSRPFTNQSFAWLAPCTDAASVAIVAPEDACAGKTFRIAAVAEPLALVSNCQWSYSDDGENWVPISSTAGIITDVITKDRWYRANVSCGTVNTTTKPRLVKLAEPYKCPCASTATTLANGADILSFQFFNNTTGAELIKSVEPSLALTSNPYAVKGYTDNTRDFTPVDVIRDSSYRIRVKAGAWSGSFTTAMVAAFIDFNSDGVFDADEQVMDEKIENTVVLPYEANATFKIRDTAKIGITRMRVVLHNGSTPVPGVCGNYFDGETEDYLVRVNYPPCKGPVSAGTLIISDSTMCNGYSYNLIDTNYEKKAANLERRWEISPDDVNWTLIKETVDKDSLVRMFYGQPLHYKVRMTCLNTNDVTYSNKVFINSKPAYKCYCYSEATGKANDSSDVGGFSIDKFSITSGSTHLINPTAYKPRTDYTDMQPIVLHVDSTYSFYVYHSMYDKYHADAKITVFMDFNNDHKYDAGYERVHMGFTDVNSHTVVDNIIIPESVITNVPTGMRVILNNNVAPNAASDEGCGAYISGETEDFIVLFKKDFPVGITDAQGIGSLQVYPNPSQGVFNISFGSVAAIKEVVITVTNVTGQKVMQQSATHAGGYFNTQVNLMSQPAGVYYAEVLADGKRMVQKLIVN